MTFEDLKRCLILLSYDTVRPEDESQTWHKVLSYTFEDGCLLKYELDGDDDSIIPSTWTTMPVLKSLKRSNRRMAKKSFFHNMFGFKLQ